MKIMIVHRSGGEVTRRVLGGLPVTLLLAAGLVAAAALGALGMRYWDVRGGVPRERIMPPEQILRDSAFLRDNVGMLAGKVGDLQARLATLDGLGRRLANRAGLRVPDGEFHSGATGGALSPVDGVMDDTDGAAAAQRYSAEDIGRLLDELQRKLEEQSGMYTVLDAALTRQGADMARMPTRQPLAEKYPYLSSSYGWRRNPVTGRMSMHEGLDFAAPSGTPIVAASGGVVVESGYHSAYGNMVEIDHGDGLITRYAHARKLLVKNGDLVAPGQQIAEVGSTGRSTGPHLHFEVRMAGQALDPKLFLAANASQSTLAGILDEAGNKSSRLR
ncbi:M23 family metallopeptidase [Kerstersia similis]|uniref:M23 family metallopeptidase n=1 Tax=Kerstersia similis TaxID=206505 RepID=UPI0039EFF648